VLGLAATSFAVAGAGQASLDAVTGHVLDRPWMRAVAGAAIPVAIGVQVCRRHQALAAEGRPEADVTPVEEGSTDPA
jgi:putative oxidoreductase